MATNTLNKENIISNTHYGLQIYAHILQEAFPADSTVIRLEGRECGLCRNPFSSGSRTLHIYIHKQDPANQLSPEMAMHKDISRNIPDGNSLLFAENYYKLQGKALLQHLNQELHLNLKENPIVTLFKAPITNKRPYRNTTLKEIYHYITTSNEAQKHTLQLRQLPPQQARMHKQTKFHYVTFSGTFSYCADKDLIEHSGLLCLDFDHVSNIQQLKQKLLEDQQIETQLLFTSPSGDGLKWVISIDTELCRHEEYYTAVVNYIYQTYGVHADVSCKNLSRACFLPYDPYAYLNPKYQ